MSPRWSLKHIVETLAVLLIYFGPLYFALKALVAADVHGGLITLVILWLSGLWFLILVALEDRIMKSAQPS